jgi:MFS family permease
MTPERSWRWHDHITVNIYWLAISISAGILTPLLLPYLVVQFMPAAQKNTYLAAVRVIGLAVAMLVQPLFGMISDRSTHRWGRRRPFIFAGAILNILFLCIIGTSPSFRGSPLNGVSLALFGVTVAYAVLVIGVMLLQFSSNVAQGAQQGLMPDVVPRNQRGRASGVKAVMELLPSFLVILVGPLVDAGQVWLTVGIIMASFAIGMAITVLGVHEVPLRQKPTGAMGGPFLRLVGLTAIFLAATQGAVWLVQATGRLLISGNADIPLQVAVVGLAGLIGMVGAIFAGVYGGARVGIGADARRQSSFIWWVINRLLFLAAVGSIQGFAQYFLKDVLHVRNAATMTTVLLAVVALFLLPSALGGGYLADRIGRKRLVGASGLIAAAGTALLLTARDIPLVIVSGCIIGLGTGTFMATNWALGTDLAPREQAGRYLGISNLAGAGAGIVGAGIGGPMADFFNALLPGLGYPVIFAIYGGLFLLSTASLTGVKTP